MLNLGSKIRSFYNGFLNSRYDGNDFYATSTALDRTMLSGEAFLAGLYPPTYDQPPWEKIFPSQLIPLYSNSSDKTLVRLSAFSLNIGLQLCWINMSVFFYSIYFTVLGSRVL